MRDTITNYKHIIILKKALRLIYCARASYYYAPREDGQKIHTHGHSCIEIEMEDERI